MAIYRDFDQAALDHQYNARATVADIEPFLERYAAISRHMRETLPCRLDLAYGPSPAERLDLFPAGAGAPLFVFFHGGYWRMLGKGDSAFMAGAFTQPGAAVAVIDYALAPAATLDEIVRQCRAAIAWLYGHAAGLGCDPERIHIGGSSAGGHLVGMCLAGGWHDALGVPETVIKGALALSGLFDLEPVRLSNVNDWIRLDAAAARRNSPVHHIPRHGCPLIVSHGGSESDEFKRQTAIYAAAWRDAGHAVSVVDMAQCNHFDIALALADPDSPLTGAMFDQMGL
jgi:arylformamidase